MESVKIFADYSQVHLLDEESSCNPGDLWVDQAVLDRFGAARDLMIVGTEVNVFVLVNLDFLDTEPMDDSFEFDHVVEGSIEVPSGSLVVMGPTDYFPDTARFDVAPGWIRIRASRSNLYNAKIADIESDESLETIEKVRIQIWVAPKADLKIIKRWQG